MQLTRGECLMLWRRRRGLTQEQLADILGVTQGVVSDWELGLVPTPNHVPAPIFLRPTPGEECQIRRRRLGLTIRDAASLYNVSHVTIIKRERDEAPNDEYLEVLRDTA